MQSHYEINVSFKGRHLFATSERSCRDQADARMVMAMIETHFPASEGFEVTCTQYAVSGVKVTLEQLEK